MKPYTVTIREKAIWTITLLANGSIDAETKAMALFRDNPNRSDLFDEDEDTTVQVEEARYE